tara:strand:+ start:156 stop:365 length:210 start_codon:yes stop_codon:yes gene_type:complete
LPNQIGSLLRAPRLFYGFDADSLLSAAPKEAQEAILKDICGFLRFFSEGIVLCAFFSYRQSVLRWRYQK